MVGPAPKSEWLELPPDAARDWSAGALGALALHAGLALAIALAVNQHELLPRPEMTVEVDMEASGAQPSVPPPAPNAGGGGAGGAIASAVPLPPSYRPPPPIVPPEFIEPVKGAPVVRTSGADGLGQPLGYGPGFGGGMGGGIGGGIGKGVGTGTGSGNATPPSDPAEPVRVSPHYELVSVERFSRLLVYPPESLERMEQGTGTLTLILLPDGKILSWKLERSTGKIRLDAEIRRVARLVDHLDPVPGMPPYHRLVARLPIRFEIRMVDP